MSRLVQKRKIHDPVASHQPTRSIESFFKVQASKRARTAEISENPALGIEQRVSKDKDLSQKPQTQRNQESSPPPLIVENSETIQEPKVSNSIPNNKLKDTPIRLPSASSKKDTLPLQSVASLDESIAPSIPVDQSPLTFNPSDYVKEFQRHWASDSGDASYSLLIRGFVLLSRTQSRIKIIDILVNLLRIIIVGDPSSLLPAVWLATNSFAPPYISSELGLGASAISKALKNIYGLNTQSLKTLYNKHGDAGDVAFEAKKRQIFTLIKPKLLTIKGVYQSLVRIAKSKGPGSQETKQHIVEKLLQDTRDPEESRYIVRTLVQHLRIGAVKTTMLIALARAFLYSGPGESVKSLVYSSQKLIYLKKEELSDLYHRAEEVVKASYSRHPNYDDLIPCLLEIGVSEELLVRCGLTIHVPLRPMLGSIIRDLPEMLAKLHGRDFTCEYKYDGQRAQVHCDERGRVSIFSRHLESMTDKYPDLVSLVPVIRGESVSSFILEGEVVAIDHSSGALQSFQVLTNRAKKNVELGSIKVNVCLFAFDLMYLNGAPLLKRPFRERRELLRSLFTEIPNRFTWVESLDATSSDSELILDFFKGAIDNKCEGIMVKVLDNVPKAGELTSSEKHYHGQAIMGEASSYFENSQFVPEILRFSGPKGRGQRKALPSTYEPDKRLESWLKVKKDYSASSETLDLIPIAGWHGQGRKAKWWSPILMAIRNPETGTLEAVTKCMSGFTDKFYEANKAKYLEGGNNVISRPSYVEYAGEPDVWFEPQEVWEMAFADITLSPTYTAAIGLAGLERGLSLRFPRFVRVREDKSIDEANTSDYLATLWKRQTEHARMEEKSPLAQEEEELS